jgi:spore germination protein KC
MGKGYSICLLMLSVIFLSGCWNRRELNDLALVVGMSIDKAELGGYLVGVQVVDPGEVASKKGTTWRTPVTIYSETGEQIFEAIRKMTKVTPRRLYFSHLQMLVLSEEIAKEGIAKPLEFMSRDNEFREDFYVVVSKRHQAREVLENVTSLEKIPANKMHSSLETSQKSWAPTISVPLDELIATLAGEGKEPVLTGVTIVGNEEKSSLKENVDRTKSYARLQYEDIAVFKKDKLIGWLNEKESKGYNYITNHVKSTVGPVPCPGEGKIGVETIRSKARVKGKVENGKPSIKVQMHIEVNVGEVSCKADLTKPEIIKQLEESVEKTNKDILEASVAKAKKLKTDIFGFGEMIHRSDPKAWKTLKKDWDQQFANMEVTIQSDVKIRRTGTVNRSFMQKEED